MKLFPIVRNLVLISIVFLTIGLISKSNFSILKKPHNPHMIDSYMTEVVTKKTNKAGEIEYLLIAKKLSHIPFESSTQMVNPEYTSIEKNGPPWVIHAENGLAKNGLDAIELWGHVEITRDKGIRNKKTTLLTSKATYYPEKNLVETKAEVTAVQPGTSVISEGMKVNTETGEIKLLGKVRGIYDPETID